MLQGVESTAGCPHPGPGAAGRMRDAAGVPVELPLGARGGCVGSSRTLGFGFGGWVPAPPGSPRRLHPACSATGRVLGMALLLPHSHCAPHTVDTTGRSTEHHLGPSFAVLGLGADPSSKGGRAPRAAPSCERSRIPRPCPLWGAPAINAPLHLAREVRRVHKENMCCELEGPA